MCAFLRFRDRFHNELSSALTQNGFLRVNKERIFSVLKRLRPEWLLIYPNEDFFVLNANNAKPIFVVIVKKDEKSDSVTLLTSNPREDSGATGLSQKEQYIKMRIKEKPVPPENLAELIVKELLNLAALKKSLRAQIHFHSRFLLGGEIAHDDGYSHIVSIARRALLHHVDFLVYTPHNSLEFNNYRIMSTLMDEFGVGFPLASEITMPLLPEHPNGPHHLVIAGNEVAATEVYKKIIEMRDSSLTMPSYFLGMTLDEMYKVLEELRKSGSVITGIAHPVNYSEKMLPIRGIGLFSAADGLHLTFDHAMELARQNDFIECWNDSIYTGEMSFKTQVFEKRIKELLAKHAGKLGLPSDIKLTPNLCNLLLATELKQYGLGQSYGSDDHTTPPLERNYLVGGDAFSRGWTALDVPEERLNGNRITVKELVEGIAKKEIKMGAALFTEVDKAHTLQITEKRKQMPDELREIVDKLKKNQYAKYIYYLIKDAFGFLSKGDIKELGKMGE
jgi:hypothetical protein